MTSLHADDAFLTYYQFSHDPFTPRVPGFKFYPAQRKSVLAQLHHLARYGQSLLLVTGPKGSGKTLLRQALVASTNKQSVQSLVLSGKECSTASGVLAQIARGIEASSAALTTILARAGQLALTGQEEYLLVDDAGLLEDEALQVLLSLAAGNGEGRLHVFLFGESELEGRLNSLCEGAEGFHPIALQPYTDDETREYILQRLEGAGQLLDLLTNEQIEEIHTKSGGWPGAINLVARETLVDAMLADRGEKASRGFSFRLPRKHLLALGIVCAAVAAAWLVSGEKQVILPKNPQLTTDSQAPEEAAPELTVEFSSENSALPQTAQPIIREPLALASGETNVDESGEAPSTAGADESTVAAKVETQASVPLPLPARSVVTASAHGDQAPPVINEKAPEAASAPASPVIAEVPRPVVSPESEVVAVVSAKSKPAPGVSVGTAWYSAQLPARFALQVLATRSEDSAKAFLKQNGSEHHYYSKAYQGAPLYVVTYGVFSSRPAAEAALKTLPAKIQALKPWPKTFSSIHKEMLKGH